jgi:6-phosphogluconate dehydrogenase
MENVTVGVIGLGRMGFSIAQRLVAAGLNVYGYDANNQLAISAQEAGITPCASPEILAQQVKIIWLMVPAGKIVDDVIMMIKSHCHKGAIIVDGGNSFYKDSVRRAQLLAESGIAYVDCGTSGGLYGKEIGYSLMLGGQADAIMLLEPVLQAIAYPQGYAHVGPSGAGHFVKTVHNGVEYAMLQAYGEGFHLLKEGPYKQLDLAQVAHVWQQGAVIRSWIGELAYNILKHDQHLTTISGSIGENATGKWTTQVADQYNIPVDVIKKSLDVRAWSRQTGGNFGTKMVAMLRNAFGGHEVKKS